MKTPSKLSTRKGFTLVELLVVIAIIAVLAAAGFSIGPAMMTRAKKLSAQAGASAVATAVDQFYTEYSALPGTGSTTPVATDTGGAGVKVLNILAAQESGSDLENPKKIRFFSYKEAKGKGGSAREGLVYGSGDAISAFVDPWGQPYYIMMDNESDTEGYDEVLKFKPEGNSEVTLRGRRVAVFSLGVDKNAKSNAKSLVKSW